MAVTITPLGFKKPDGNELVRGGDNAISANAQKADDLIAATSGRLAYVEAAVTSVGGTGAGYTLAPDPDNAGLYFIV